MGRQYSERLGSSGSEDRQMGGGLSSKRGAVQQKLQPLRSSYCGRECTSQGEGWDSPSLLPSSVQPVPKAS